MQKAPEASSFAPFYRPNDAGGIKPAALLLSILRVQIGRPFAARRGMEGCFDRPR